MHSKRQKLTKHRAGQPVRGPILVGNLGAFAQPVSAVLGS